jgi:rubrerythrin
MKFNINDAFKALADIKDDDTISNTKETNTTSLNEQVVKNEGIKNLEPEFDSRNSFYNKARVDEKPDGTKILWSYNTPVCKIKDGKVTLLHRGYLGWSSSATTLRHVKEFLLQNGFEAGSYKELAAKYPQEQASIDEGLKESWIEPSILQIGSKGYNNLKKACDILNNNTVKGFKYRLGTLSFDAGKGWNYTAIIANNPNEKNSVLSEWHALTPSDWGEIVNAADDEALKRAIAHVKKSSYFLDKTTKDDDKFATYNSEELKKMFVQDYKGVSIYNVDGKYSENPNITDKRFDTIEELENYLEKRGLVTEAVDPKQGDGLFDPLIDDEHEAIDGYEEKKKSPKANDKDKALFDKIIGEEKNHIAWLEKAKAEKATKTPVTEAVVSPNDEKAAFDWLNKILNANYDEKESSYDWDKVNNEIEKSPYDKEMLKWFIKKLGELDDTGYDYDSFVALCGHYSKSDSLKEDTTFNVRDDKDIEKAKDFLKSEDKESKEQIIDVDADSIDNLKKSYVGKIILQCPTCHTERFINAEQLKKAEDKTEDGKSIYNKDEECPHCGASDGFIVVGQVGKFNDGASDTTDSNDDTTVTGIETDITPDDKKETKNDEPEEDKPEEVKESYTDFDEKSFDSLINNYLTKVYDNFASYTTTQGTVEKNKLMLEGMITFKSGKQTKTNFIFDSQLKDNKILLDGINETFSKDKAFSIQGEIVNKTVICEELHYNYKQNDVVVEGLVNKDK